MLYEMASLPEGEEVRVARVVCWARTVLLTVFFRYFFDNVIDGVLSNEAFEIKYPWQCIEHHGDIAGSVGYQCGQSSLTFLRTI